MLVSIWLFIPSDCVTSLYITDLFADISCADHRRGWNWIDALSSQLFSVEVWCSGNIDIHSEQALIEAWVTICQFSTDHKIEAAKTPSFEPVSPFSECDHLFSLPHWRINTQLLTSEPHPHSSSWEVKIPDTWILSIFSSNHRNRWPEQALVGQTWADSWMILDFDQTVLWIVSAERERCWTMNESCYINNYDRQKPKWRDCSEWLFINREVNICENRPRCGFAFPWTWVDFSKVPGAGEDLRAFTNPPPVPRNVQNSS
jgi:hypothetical protein